MSKIYLALVTVVIFSATTYLLISCKSQSAQSSSNSIERKDKQDEIEKAWAQEIAFTRDPNTKDVPRERLVLAESVVERQLALQGQGRFTTAIGGINWTERGPDNRGGRSRVSHFDLGDAANGYKKLWAGGVGGGLWYTNDITASTPTWVKVDDFWDNLAVTCLAQDPANPLVMYVGTGEGFGNSDAIKGLGIWKTTNGGAIWSRISSTNISYVQDLKVGVGGKLYGAFRPYYGSDLSGILSSSDGGATWIQLVGDGVTSNGSTRGMDIEIAADNTIYTSIREMVNGNNSIGSIWKSSTGAVGSFTQITPFNTTNAIFAPTTATSQYQRIELATAPSNANIVYAVFQGIGSNDVTNIKKYTASTNTWTSGTVPTIIDQGSNSIYTRSQAWYDLIAAVDPNDPNSIYIGGIDALRSDNGGTTWTQMTTWSLYLATGFGSAQNVHADQHAITYAPGSSSRAIWGTDGGLYYTANANIVNTSKPTWVTKNQGYNVTQFYHVANHPTNPNYFLAGAQDNGTHKFTTAGLNNTTEPTGGDGGYTHIDQDNPLIQITSYVNNNYYVSTDGGSSFTTRSKNNNGSFINPTDYDDAQNILYGGQAASQYFRWLDPATDGASGAVTVSAFSGGTVTHVAVSTTSANTVFFGLNNGRIIKVDNANTGTTVTGTVFFNSGISGSISGIAIDPNNSDHVVATLANYGVNSVWETTDNGANWASIEGNLPDMPVRWCQIDPRNSKWVYLATELGVWSTNNVNGASTDWTATNTGLANVRVDAMQYTSGTRVLSAATHGRGLFTTVIPTVSTPNVQFSTASATFTEETDQTSGCRKYKDYSTNLNILNAPTGTANILLSISGASTATRGVDYEITTTNFTTPTLTGSFANGSTTAIPINIRIYDDAEVESAENFILNFAISGTTNAQIGTINQSLTVTINDNDANPVGVGSPTVYTIPGTYQTTLSNGSPFKATVALHRYQMIYKASELVAAGITRSATINELSLTTVAKGTTLPYTNFNLSLANTTREDFNTGGYETGTTNVFSGSFSTTTGTTTIVFTTPFVWNGVSNLVIEFCYTNAATAAANDTYQGATAPFGVGTRASMYSNHPTTTGATGCVLAPAFVSDSRPLANFRATLSGTTIATAASATSNEFFANNNVLNYYTATGEILAKLSNSSAFSYGCNPISIDRSGTGAQTYRNVSSATFIMNKTYFISPATNNTSGVYTATFYFTAAEKTGWESATGNSWSSIRMIKTPAAIGTYSTATPPPSEESVAPTFGTFGTGFTLTGTFTSGFSGFGFGIPSGVLPVKLLSFTGSLQYNKIPLSWTTSTETNSSHFIVEKSTDGVRYEQLGRVNASGNSTTNKTYGYTDYSVLPVNYYRLVSVDKDGKTVISEVVVVKSNKPANVITVTNPVRTEITVRFSTLPIGMVLVNLYDVKGNLILQQQYGASSTIRIDLTKNRQLAAGIYLLKTSVDGKTYSNKIIKE